jgi:hypothetical protein
LTTIAAAIHFHAVTMRQHEADDAGHRFADVVDSVWICGPVTTNRLGASGVFLVSMKVNAPEHEVTKDAPILARALNAASHVCPSDSLQVKPLQKGDRGYIAPKEA